MVSSDSIAYQWKDNIGFDPVISWLEIHPEAIAIFQLLRYPFSVSTIFGPLCQQYLDTFLIHKGLCIVNVVEQCIFKI